TLSQVQVLEEPVRQTTCTSEDPSLCACFSAQEDRFRTGAVMNLFSTGDVDLLTRCCSDDEATPALVQAICQSKSAGVLRIVQGRLLAGDAQESTGAFASCLARALGKLRSTSASRGSNLDFSAKKRLLRAAGLCVSKVLQTADLPDMANGDLHRGLRRPALLLALLGIVQDNKAGSGAQRAAGSALVAFCDSSPGLWKELAKEVRSSKTLLQGFLKPVSTLASIADHRTQELVFEALYRLWKA
ncbi:unnamed protein product, partial [Ectocarpus sp. 12 AP-2014]